VCLVTSSHDELSLAHLVKVKAEDRALWFETRNDSRDDVGLSLWLPELHFDRSRGNATHTFPKAFVKLPSSLSNSVGFAFRHDPYKYHFIFINLAGECNTHIPRCCITQL
jgi:hypothetical protein